jgi:hypothetical protein
MGYPLHGDRGRTRRAFRVSGSCDRTEDPTSQGANASWEYRFAATDDGRTRVTETWFDDRIRWPDAVAAVFDRIVTRGMTFPEFQRKNIAKTLQALRAAAERP